MSSNTTENTINNNIEVGFLEMDLATNPNLGEVDLMYDQLHQKDTPLPSNSKISRTDIDGLTNQSEHGFFKNTQLINPSYTQTGIEQDKKLDERPGIAKNMFPVTPIIEKMKNSKNKIGD